MGGTERAVKKVSGYRFTIIVRVIALTLCVGALPFLFGARTYAQEAAEELKVQGEELKVQNEKPKSQWLDDYSQHVGLTYNAQARIQTAYLWRGLYCGAPNIQASANVGYGGLYIDMWWNLGVTNWQFNTFQPEVDISLGFNRWGLNVYLLYVYNFNTGFFDFNGYSNMGNRLELDVQYTVSSKLPLSFLWATRIAASDHYLNESGEAVRAWSSYAEISYTHHMRDGWSLYGAIGITPWKSLYNLRGAAVQNIEVRLRKDWDVAKRCGLMLQAQLCVNPAAELNIIHPNMAFGVYLK